MRKALTIDKDVRYVLRRLNECGHEAFIVGGAVRDLLLDRSPKDFDIATSATPAEIKDAFGRSARIIGRRFKLAHVHINRTCYEVSTFRREPTAAERTSREDDDGVMIWRDNQYGTMEQDALRRDFTVNALYYSPLAEPPFHDFCAGESDLRKKTIRAIGNPDTRLAEDPVRIIRALKLMGEYDFHLSHDLVAPLKARACMLAHCSQARLFEELLKILHKPFALPTFEALSRHGALAAFIPNLAAGWKSTVGKTARNMLAIRDARQAEGDYSNSRVLGLATMCFPFVCEALDIGEGCLWEPGAEVEREIRAVVLTFFTPLPLPRAITARIRDAMMLLPRFRQSHGRQRIIAHPEYRYARELYSILTAVHGWSPEIVEQWPALGTGHPRRNQPSARRRGGRGRRRGGKS